MIFYFSNLPLETLYFWILGQALFKLVKVALTTSYPMKFSKLNRLFHRWGSIIVAAPVLLVLISGILLMLKKESDWIQPPTKTGSPNELLISFDQILKIATTVPEARIHGWDDIARLDVRPGKGMLKVRGTSGWEIQLDSQSGEILQVAYRRTGLIESLHDGTFFHTHAKLWFFLPSAIILLGLWITGIYLFLFPSLARKNLRNKKMKLASNNSIDNCPDK